MFVNGDDVKDVKQLMHYDLILRTII